MDYKAKLIEEQFKNSINKVYEPIRDLVYEEFQYKIWLDKVGIMLKPGEDDKDLRSYFNKNGHYAPKP